MNCDSGQLLAGRYRLDQKVGSGGAGTVWAAVDEVLGRHVAVKDVGGPLWTDLEGRQAVRERTLREARAAASIDHPNVVTVYDVVEVDERPWIVMELVRARTLAQVIDEDGPRTPEQAAHIGLQLLEALRAAHALGILHRDVKPSNVLLTPDGRAVLTDFGIATIDGDSALTAAGTLVGAPAFIAPERVRSGPGSRTGPASDLWSLGATLYTAVEGRPPYLRDGAICTIAAVVHDEPDPVERAGHLAPVLAALLRRDPELRPSATEVHDLLTQVVDRERRAATASDATTAGGSGERTTTVIRPRRLAATHAVALFSAVGLLFTVLLVGILAELVGTPDTPARPGGGQSPVDQPGPTLTTPGTAPAPATGPVQVAPAAGPGGGNRPGPSSQSISPPLDEPAPETPSAPPVTSTAPGTTAPTTTQPPTTTEPSTTAESTTAPATAPA